MKRAFSEQDVLSIDSGYFSSDSYRNLSQDAKNFTAVFGSTYCCKQLFSRMKQEFVRPRWPYDMRPSARAEKYMCVIVIR